MKRGRKVFKIQKKKHALESDEEFEELLAMDKKERSVRLWNQICGVGEAEEYEDGWTAPYIDGTDASEMDIAHTLVDIYERTGRIVVDAAVRGNFKKSNQGDVVCVDVGCALKLESRIASDQSQVSLDFWDLMHEDYREYFDENFAKSPFLINTIKALLVLQYYRPDVRSLKDVMACEVTVNKISGYYANRNQFIDSDIEQKLSINFNYFQEISHLKILITREDICVDGKESLCRLYLKDELTPTQATLIELLMNNLKLNFEDSLFFSSIKRQIIIDKTKKLIISRSIKREAIEVIIILEKSKIFPLSILDPKNLEIIGSIDFKNSITACYNNGKLNRSTFEEIISCYYNAAALKKSEIYSISRLNEMNRYNDCDFFTRIIREMSEKNSLSATRFEIILCLKKAGILVKNFSKLTHNNWCLFKMLELDINKGRRVFNSSNVKTQDEFDSVFLDLRINLVASQVNQEKSNMSALSIIKQNIESIREYKASFEEKITAYEGIIEIVNGSCLKNERGIHKLFCTKGNTKSYQAAMNAVKTALLSELKCYDVDTVNNVNTRLENIFIIQTGRLHHPLGSHSARTFNAIMS